MIPVQTFKLIVACDLHGSCEHSVTFKRFDFITKKVYFYQFCLSCEMEAWKAGKIFFSNEYSTSIKNWDLCTPIEDEPKLN